MKIIDGPNQVQHISDIIMGCFGGEINQYKEIDQTIASFNAQFSPEDFDKFSSDLKSEGGESLSDEYLKSAYQEYKDELEDEKKEAWLQLNTENNQILSLDPHIETLAGKYGSYEFSALQYDTEGVECSVLPYQWMCNVSNSDGESTCLIYGTFYTPIDDFGARYNDITYIADIESHQELMVTEKLARVVSQRGESCDRMITKGPLVTIQYMQRDLSNDQIIGVGFDAVKFSLECILNILEAPKLTVAICMGLYQYQYSGSKESVMTKITNKFERFFENDFKQCGQHYFIPFTEYK